MVASRTRLAGGLKTVRFWLSAFCTVLVPTSVGYQDFTALLARQPAMSQHWREHLIASPFGTIEARTFSYGRPIGTTLPQPPGFQLVNYEPGPVDAKAWSIDQTLSARPMARIAYPTVNRRLKGDRLPLPAAAPAQAAPESLPQLQPIDATPAPQPLQPATEPSPPATEPIQPPPAFKPRPHGAELPDQMSPVAQAEVLKAARAAAIVAAARTNAAASLVQTQLTSRPERNLAMGAGAESEISDAPPAVGTDGESDAAPPQPRSLASLSFLDDASQDRGAQIYFGAGVLGAPSALERWAPGAEPVMAAVSVDAGIKRSALEGVAEDGPGGESLAGKDDASRLKSPAERLNLAGKERARAEKCIADAVYFEARGEPLKGQEAVAQVVMNRVFSGYYPNNVCGVVYQNANRHLACQFTFACEGRDLTRIDEPDMWEQAKRIAKDTLDGKIWLADVGHATHYHAYWVHPSWVHEMTRLYKLGVHTFYRPRAWGSGDADPVWGKSPDDAKPDDAASKPQAAATPVAPVANRDGATAKL